MDHLYEKFMNEDGVLSIREVGLCGKSLTRLLRDELFGTFDEGDIMEMLQKARVSCRSTCDEADGTIDRLIFSSLWQRLMLGAVVKYNDYQGRAPPATAVQKVDCS